MEDEKEKYIRNMKVTHHQWSAGGFLPVSEEWDCCSPGGNACCLGRGPSSDCRQNFSFLKTTCTWRKMLMQSEVTPLNTLTLVLFGASARTHKRILHWNSLTLYMSTVSQYSQLTSWQRTYFMQKIVGTASSEHFCDVFMIYVIYIKTCCSSFVQQCKTYCADTQGRHMLHLSPTNTRGENN